MTRHPRDRERAVRAPPTASAASVSGATSVRERARRAGGNHHETKVVPPIEEEDRLETRILLHGVFDTQDLPPRSDDLDRLGVRTRGGGEERPEETPAAQRASLVVGGTTAHGGLIGARVERAIDVDRELPSCCGRNRGDERESNESDAKTCHRGGALTPASARSQARNA